MHVTRGSLPGLLWVEGIVHEDGRGWFEELVRASDFEAAGLPARFEQDNLTGSRRGVLRGLHYQSSPPQGKLVRVLRGEIWDVAVDLRRSSPSFRRWSGFPLRAEDHRALWIPPGFAHGFYVTSDWAEVSYKVSAEREAAADRAVRWDDPSLAIQWPPMDDPPTLSARDAAAPFLADAECFP